MYIELHVYSLNLVRFCTCNVRLLGTNLWCCKILWWTARRLPWRWTAPEIISKGQFSTKSDVWAYGILLHEVYTNGESPYEGILNLIRYRMFIIYFMFLIVPDVFVGKVHQNSYNKLVFFVKQVENNQHNPKPIYVELLISLFTDRIHWFYPPTRTN